MENFPSDTPAIVSGMGALVYDAPRGGDGCFLCARLKRTCAFCLFRNIIEEQKAVSELKIEEVDKKKSRPGQNCREINQRRPRSPPPAPPEAGCPMLTPEPPRGKGEKGEYFTPGLLGRMMHEGDSPILKSLPSAKTCIRIPPMEFPANRGEGKYVLPALFERINARRTSHELRLKPCLPLPPPSPNGGKPKL